MYCLLNLGVRSDVVYAACVQKLNLFFFTRYRLIISNGNSSRLHSSDRYWSKYNNRTYLKIYIPTVASKRG